MKTINMPGFTAENTLYTSSASYVGLSLLSNRLSNGILPSLMINFPCQFTEAGCDDGYGGSFDGGTGGFVGFSEPLFDGDDTNAWGVSPGIGDVKSRQCKVLKARCNRIKDPVAREICLESTDC